MRSLEVVIRGRVQGVGFRAFTRREALGRGLTGFVENALDGSVHVVVKGSRESLEDFIEVLRRGPAGAIVSSVDVEDTGKWVDTPTFVVRR